MTRNHMGKSEFDIEARAALEDDIDRCPICAVPFKPEDVCADDVTEGTCHAECLEGSPVVDLDTGAELPNGKADTYLYRDVMAPPPQPHVPAMKAPWQWWAGSTEECFTVGPEDTREAIIQAATNDSLGEFQHEEGGWNLGFHIVEARSDPLRLADWIESDRLLERAEDSVADSDRISSENDEGPWFDCTPEQEKDLEERVKRACDEWEAAHGLTFACATFSHTRNQEHIVVELPDDRATTEGSDNG